MRAVDMTTEAFANTRPGADALPDYAPVPRSALGHHHADHAGA